MLKITGSKKAITIINETVIFFPKEVKEYLINNAWFICSFDDAWAYTFDSDDLRNRKLIFLSDELFVQSKKQIIYTIAHEIGHVFLGHRNSIYEDQSHNEVNIQEKAAHEFAKSYIN